MISTMVVWANKEWLGKLLESMDRCTDSLDIYQIDFENGINSLPDEKILGLPKLRAFADDKSNVTQNVKVVFHRIENIVGK